MPGAPRKGKRKAAAIEDKGAEDDSKLTQEEMQRSSRFPKSPRPVDDKISDDLLFFTDITRSISPVWIVCLAGSKHIKQSMIIKQSSRKRPSKT